MTTGEPRPPIRIGNAERTAAMRALDEHLAAGRLGVEEYGDRSAAAANATVAGDLAVLFTDLPAPHPELPGVGGPPPSTAELPVAGAVAARQPGFFETWGPTFMKASPIIALLLFLLTRQWWMFLLVPLAGAFVYGRNDK